VAALWVGISILFAFVGPAEAAAGAAIAWTAHVGGFIGGLLLFWPVMRRCNSFPG